MKPLKHLSKQLTCQLKEFHPPLSIPALYPFVVPLSNKQNNKNWRSFSSSCLFVHGEFGVVIKHHKLDSLRDYHYNLPCKREVRLIPNRLIHLSSTANAAPPPLPDSFTWLKITRRSLRFICKVESSGTNWVLFIITIIRFERNHPGETKLGTALLFARPQHQQKLWSSSAVA